MTLSAIRFRALVGAAIVAMSLTNVAMAAEEHTIDAFATWEGRGQFFQVGTNTAEFVGAFAGTLFVSEEKRLVQGGKLVCPGTFDINLENGSFAGNGRCVLADDPGERLYATWKCTGALGQGCAGVFTLIEGTGRWKGVSGSGPFSSQSDLQSLTAVPGNIVSQTLNGVMVWRGFHYTLP